MKPKKADFILGEFTVKIIIGVLCLVALIAIAVYISGLFTKQSQKNQADATLKDIVNQIEYLRKSNFSEIGYDYRSPGGWYVYSGESVSQGKSYLCICPRSNYESCIEGFCKEIANIAIDKSLLNQPIAKEKAEVIIIKKEKLNDISKFTLSK